MHLFTSPKCRFNLTLVNLADSENPVWLNQAAEWAERKWGYIRKFPGVEYRRQAIKRIENDFYILVKDGCPIGMFALLEKESHIGDIEMKMKELMYFYIDEEWRGFGIGSQMFRMAKEKAAETGHSLVFDTLSPDLNRFYEKQGATVVCEGSFVGHPSTVMRV